MSASHDRKFFDTFMLVLGILLGVTIGLIILARLIAGPNLLQHKSEDPVFQQELLARIAPVARVAVAGEDNSALAAPAPAAEAVAAAEDLPGETVYNQACVACHGAGIAGAPNLGDKAAWAPRIATGSAALIKSAINGKNAMPPKGGSDANEIEMARVVAFMANKSGASFKEPAAK